MHHLEPPVEGHYIPLLHLVARLRCEYFNGQSVYITSYKLQLQLLQAILPPLSWRRGPHPPAPSWTPAPGTSGPRKDPPPAFKCDRCSSNFENESGLKIHIGNKEGSATMGCRSRPQAASSSDRRVGPKAGPRTGTGTPWSRVAQST